MELMIGHQIQQNDRLRERLDIVSPGINPARPLYTGPVDFAGDALDIYPLSSSAPYL